MKTFLISCERLKKVEVNLLIFETILSPMTLSWPRSWVSCEHATKNFNHLGRIFLVLNEPLVPWWGYWLEKKPRWRMLRIELLTWVEEPQHMLPLFDPKVVHQSWKLVFTKEQHEQQKKESVEWKNTMHYWNCGKTSHWSKECNEEKKNTWKMIRGKTHWTFITSTLGHCLNNWYMDSCYS